MIKRLLKQLIERTGFSLNRHQYFERKNYGTIYVPRANKNKLLSTEIIETIMKFYNKIPPFYADKVIEPLKIGGAWKDYLLERRTRQLSAIKAKNIDEYKNLLNNMFRNEMTRGMWCHLYYNENVSGKPFPRGFIEEMDGFKYLTGRREDELVCCNFGNGWGYKTERGIIKVNDPSQGIKADIIINILNALNQSRNRKLTFVDLGSGYGGDVEKVVMWFNNPIRIYLVDIPLNLTTAYAYISAGFPECKKHLIDSAEKLREITLSDNNEIEFVFVPTLYVEDLKNIEINLLFNHGSLSEMDYITIEFYLQVLVTENTDFLLEINSNTEALNTSNHIEIQNTRFPVPKTHSLLSRTPTWLTPKGHRYLQNLWINNRLLK
jgi:hypothetical protein|tara:strand:- start:119 stop:1252 length:1134 start_codon:yes stop_codon:yes gene_type:complete